MPVETYGGNAAACVNVIIYVLTYNYYLSLIYGPLTRNVN